jgi:hypothetical protein
LAAVSYTRSEVTTGVPIYLVSACSSSEEFVAAFRRYVDRSGVFVPIAEPLPVGKRGRFALTLRDGRVMIEGDGEIVSSFAKPAPLQGRVGMTVRFSAPDEPSKTVLAEVEKARLMPKPPATSVAPRPADVPASPRPAPPVVGGRIDATNALAECVAILPPGSEPAAPPPVADTGSGGNVAAWKPAAMPKAMPAIPDRPKTPSVPPPVVPKPELKPKSTVLGMTPLDRVKSIQPRPRTGESPLLPRKDLDSGRHLAVTRTPSAPVPVVDPPRDVVGSKSGPIPAPLPPASSEPTFTPTHYEAVPEPNGELKVEAEKPVRAESTPRPAINRTPTIRGVKPPAFIPGMAARAPEITPPEAPPTVQMPTPHLEPEGEPTDLTEIPVVSERKTVLGVVAPTTPDEPVDPLAPTLLPDQLNALSASHRAAAEPTGDWTMSPDDSTPRKLVAEPPPPPPPPGRPSGDWLIQVAPDRPDGWTEPERLSKKPADKPAEQRGAVIRAEAVKPAVVRVEAVKPADKPKPAGDEPKVQIDPTLIEPLQDLDEPVPPPPPPPEPVYELPRMSPIASAFRTPVFSASQSQPFPLVEPAQMQPVVGGVHAAAYPTPVPGAMPEGYPTYAPGQLYPDPAAVVGFPPLGPGSPGPTGHPLARMVTDGGTGFFEGAVIPYSADSQPRLEARRRGRILVIAISAALAVAAGVVLVVLMSNRDGEASDAPTTALKPPPKVDEHPAPPTPGSGSQVAEVQSTRPDAPADAAVAPPPPAVCYVDLSTTPTAAEVAIDNDHQIGTTPVKLELPCGAETKLYIRKRGYIGAIKPVTPAPDAPPVKVTLPRAIYSVKVSSSPAGATITVGGKTMGVTPTTVKLPAFETSTLIMTKDGFATEAQTLTPKTNNQTVHVTMKKKRH